MNVRTLWVGSSALIVVAFLLGQGVAGAADDESDPEGVESVWSIEGRWTGVAADHQSGTVFALGEGDKCIELDADGQIRRELSLPAAGRSVLRCAEWPGKAEKVLLTFATWSKELRVYDLSGKERWTYPVGMGIDDVWPVELTPDVGGVAVGYNGNGGLHLLDEKGALLWKSTAIGNVWHVAAADVLGDGTTQIVSTSARGQVHIFSGDGMKRNDQDPGLYANMVRAGKLAEKDEAATIIVGGSGLAANARNSTFVAAISGKGDKLWALEIPPGKGTNIAAATLARNSAWLAVSTGGGKVFVIDASTGEFVANLSAQGRSPEVAWLGQREPKLPLLIVAAGGKLNAYGFVGGPK